MARERQYRYFLYSRDQHKLRDSAEAAINKQYIPGRVISGGKWRDFTEMSTSQTINKFADAKVVAQGYLDKMTYTNAKSEWRSR